MHKLEQIRENLQISKSEMARRLGISKSNYSMIIHGQHGVSKRVALKAYEVFGVSLKELLYSQVQQEATNKEAAAEAVNQ